MNSTTHKGHHFTEIQKNNIRRATRTEASFRRDRPNKYLIFSLIIAAVSIFILLISTEVMIPPGTSNGNTDESTVDQWEVRHEYRENNQILFNVYPDPQLTAGKPFGYLFSFREPFETYEGKELSINAYNKKTGERMLVSPPQKITAPSPGYVSLQRFTTTFLVPYSGLWKYEVLLNGKVYGDVIVSVSEKPEDNLPEFVQESDYEQINWDRKATAFGHNIIGNKNKSGVIGADMPSLTNQKWMWHLWGTDAKELTVVGYHRETGTVHPVLNNGWTIDLAGEHNGADAHAVSSVKIPMQGEWAILLYADGELFDVLVYDIEE